jgi:hypothetical protein
MSRERPTKHLSMQIKPDEQLLTMDKTDKGDMFNR